MTHSSPVCPPAQAVPQVPDHAVGPMGITYQGVRYEVARTEEALMRFLDRIRQAA